MVDFESKLDTEIVETETWFTKQYHQALATYWYDWAYWLPVLLVSAILGHLV